MGAPMAHRRIMVRNHFSVSLSSGRDVLVDCGRYGVFTHFLKTMDSSSESKLRLIKEAHRGCVRLRWYEYDSAAGKKQAIEVSACNAWAGQSKLLSVTTGLGVDAASACFHELAHTIRDFDWLEGEFVPAIAP